jgi:hypothetical protein
MLVEENAQPAALAALGGLRDAEEQVRDAHRKPCGLHGRKRGGSLHQGLAGAARFRDRDEVRGRERQPLEQRRIGAGIEIVHEMQTRARAQEACAGHCVVLKLRQGLPAEA